MPALRIVVVDDHPVVRGGLRALIGTLDGLEVVGEAEDGESAVREVQLLHPDVVLMDVRMPGGDGVEATRRIRSSVPDTAVLVLTMHDDDATVFTAMQAGARGYLLKGASQDEIVSAIRGVVAGQLVFGPGVAARVLAYFSAGPPQGDDALPFPELTAREREVLDLLASGRRTASIAEALYVSPKTVSNHLTSIFTKLEVADRAAAMIRAQPRPLAGAAAVISTPLLVALAVMGLAWLASAAAMGLRGRALAAAAALAMAGAGTLTATVVDASGHPDAARLALALSWALALPLALTAYPRLVWRHAVDFVALVTVLATGVMAAVQLDAPGTVDAAGVTLLCVLVAHTWWRIERADAPDRRALTWLAVVGGGVCLVALVIIFVASTVPGGVVAALLFALVGPAMLLGVTRPEAVDVRVVAVQVVVVAVVLFAYIALFTALAAMLEILHGEPASVAELAVAGAVVALAMPPLRTALRGVVDELLFGTRSDPLEAATHVAGHSAGDPVLALRAVREALGLPYAMLRVDGSVVASSGMPVTSTHVVPLSLGDRSTGELEVGLRPGDARMSPADENALGLVAPLVALTARSAALAAALQESREQSVTAIEEERRRLRRDLHDGLGPRLSGVAFTADAARNSVRVDPAAAEGLLLQMRADTTTAIEEIRGLVYGMRPPALDELGLVRAIRQQALALRTPSGAPLRLDLQAPQVMPVLTAAVEVAAFRIVLEGLTNAVRHSGSDRATVCLRVEGGELVLDIADGGVGDGGTWRPGVGMASMRERAQELGGTLEAGPDSTGGRVLARLPLAPARPATA